MELVSADSVYQLLLISTVCSSKILKVFVQLLSHEYSLLDYWIENNAKWTTLRTALMSEQNIIMQGYYITTLGS